MSRAVVVLLLASCSLLDRDVSGVVVDEEGRPLGGVVCVAGGRGFGVELLMNDGRGMEPSVTTEADGRFVLPVEGADDEVRLAFVLDGHVTHDVVERRGTDDLRVVLRRGCVVEGSVLVDEGIPTESLRVTLSGWTDWPGVLEGRVPAILEADGRFRSAIRVPAGTVTASVSADEVAADGFGVPVAEVGGIVVDPEGPAARPEIDARGALRVVEVRASDGGGAPVPDLTLWIPVVDEFGDPDEAFEDADEDGVIRLVRRPEGFPLRDAFVCADGFRRAALGDLEESQVVRLEPALRVEVRLRPRPALREGERLDLRATDGGPGPDPDPVAIDEDGVAALSLPSTGPWTLSVRFRGDPPARADVRLGPDSAEHVLRVPDEETRLDLDLPADALDEARARAEKLAARIRARRG